VARSRTEYVSEGGGEGAACFETDDCNSKIRVSEYLKAVMLFDTAAQE
jgi:hypothetical protein